VKVFNEWKQVPMNSFPNLSDEDIDNIIAYTSTVKETPKAGDTGASTQVATNNNDVSNMVILVALGVVLAMLVIMLFLVKKVLAKVVEKNGLTIQEQKSLPIWKAF